MEGVYIIGIDLAKHNFQLHGARADGSVAFRQEADAWEGAGLSGLAAACVVAEACAVAHYWGRLMQARPRGEARAAGLREAVRQTPQERRGGCGGDLEAAFPDDAFR